VGHDFDSLTSIHNMDLIQGYGSNSCSDDDPDPDSELDETSGLDAAGNAGSSISTSEASPNAQKRRQETIDASSAGATRMLSTALKRPKRKRESEHGTNSTPVRLSFTILDRHASVSASTSTNACSLNPKNGNEDRRQHHFKRTQEHIQGNWAGHVYLKIPCGVSSNSYMHSEQEELLNAYVRNTLQYFQNRMEGKHGISSPPSIGCDANDEVIIVPHVSISIPQEDEKEMPQSQLSGSDLESESSSEDDEDENMDHRENENSPYQALHISLCRPFYLQKQSVPSFLSDLRKRIQISILETTMYVRVRVFTKMIRHTGKFSHQGQQQKLEVLDMEILSNDEKTRSFLTVPVTSTSGSFGIPSIISMIDSIMKKYGHQEYYEDPKFHFSIASWKYNEAVIERWRDLQEYDVDYNSVDKEDVIFFPLKGLHCDFGTVEKHYIPFGQAYR
jgi:hypothetical protein